MARFHEKLTIQRGFVALFLATLAIAHPGRVGATAPNAPPIGGGGGIDFTWLIVSAALPWALPDMPTNSISLTMPDLDGLEHSPDYGATVTAFNDSFEDFDADIAAYDNSLSGIETTLNAPASPGDFDPGLEPEGTPTTVYALADAIGANIGTVFGYIRALRVLDFAGTGPFFGFILIGISWVALNLSIKVALGLASDIWGLLVTLWEAIPFL